MSKKRLQDFENTEIVYAEGLTFLQLNTGLNLYNATYEEESNYQSSNMMWFGINKKDVIQLKYGNIINEYTVTYPLFILLLDPENKQNITYLKLLTDDSDIECLFLDWKCEEQGRYTEVDCDYQVVNELVKILPKILPKFSINGIGTGTGRGEQAHHPEILLFKNSFDKFTFTGSDHSIKNHPIYRSTLDRRERQAAAKKAKIAARKARRKAAQNTGGVAKRLFGFGS